MNNSRERVGHININKKQYIVYKGINTLGRNKNAVINLPHINVSHHHAIITSIDRENHYISDINSANGTLLNKIKLKPFELYKLESNDEIVIGSLIGRFQRILENRGTPDENDITIGPESSTVFSENFYLQHTQHEYPISDHTYNVPYTRIHEMETQVILQPTENIHELETQIIPQPTENIHELETQIIPQPTENIHEMETQIILQPTENIHEMATQIVGTYNLPQNVHDLDTQKMPLSDISNIHEMETQIINKNIIFPNEQNNVEESVFNEDSNESVDFLNQPSTSTVVAQIHSNVGNISKNSSSAITESNTDDSQSTINVGEQINPANDSGDELGVPNKEEICKISRNQDSNVASVENPTTTESLETVVHVQDTDEELHCVNFNKTRKNPRIIDSNSSASGEKPLTPNSSTTIADSDDADELLPLTNRKNPRILESSISSVENHVANATDSDETDDEIFTVNVRPSNVNSKTIDSKSSFLNKEKIVSNNCTIIDSDHTDIEDELIGSTRGKCNLIDSSEENNSPRTSPNPTIDDSDETDIEDNIALIEEDKNVETRRSFDMNDSNFIPSTQDYQTENVNNDNVKLHIEQGKVVNVLNFVPPTPDCKIKKKNTAALIQIEYEDSFMNPGEPGANNAVEANKENAILNETEPEDSIRLCLGDSILEETTNETTNISLLSTDHNADNVYLLPTQKFVNEQPRNTNTEDIYLQATQNCSENEDQIYLQPTQSVIIEEDIFKKPTNVNTVANKPQKSKEIIENGVYENDTQVFDQINNERVDFNTNLNINEDVYNQPTQKCQDATQEIINISNQSNENQNAESDRPLNPLSSVFDGKITNIESQFSNNLIDNVEDEKTETSVNKNAAVDVENEETISVESKINKLNNDNVEPLLIETRRSKRTKDKEQNVVKLHKNVKNDPSTSSKVPENQATTSGTKRKASITSINIENNITESRKSTRGKKTNHQEQIINESPTSKPSEMQKNKTGVNSTAIRTRNSKRNKIQNNDESTDEEQSSGTETKKNKRIKNENKVLSSPNKTIKENGRINTRNRNTIKTYLQVPETSSSSTTIESMEKKSAIDLSFELLNKSASIKKSAVDNEPVIVKLNHKNRKSMAMVPIGESDPAVPKRLLKQTKLEQTNEILSPSSKTNITDLQTGIGTRTRTKRLNSNSSISTEISNAGRSTRSKRTASVSSTSSEISNINGNSRTTKIKSDSSEKMEETKVTTDLNTSESLSRKRNLSSTDNSTPSKLTRLNKTINSPRSKVLQRTMKPKVVFTMLESPELEAIIRQMGGKVVDNVEDCTVLVTASVKRSKKLLSIIGYAKPICGPQWIQNSKKANQFLDPWNHIIVDKEAETKWKFSLNESLIRSANTKLLEGYTFQIVTNTLTENVVDILKGAIKSCGGKIVARLPTKSSVNCFIIAAKENKNIYSNIMKKNSNVKVIESEAIFDGVLRQEIRFDKHLLS